MHRETLKYSPLSMNFKGCRIHTGVWKYSDFI